MYISNTLSAIKNSKKTSKKLYLKAIIDDLDLLKKTIFIQ